MSAKEPEKITVPVLQRMKRDGRSIAMLTAYDASMAYLLDSCGIDILLVGDSLGMVFQGEENTLGVTLDHVIYHTRAVTRGARRAHVVADMPFMSYQTSDEEGLRNAGRLLKEGGAHAVKLEGGQRHVSLVGRLTEVGIPVMGHIGLTPQSIHAMGGYKIQGRRREQGRVLLEDALALQDAGIYSLVLEGVPRELAQQITDALEIPTIGIGAGPGCDGQVLVINDVLGLDDRFAPKFVKRYESLSVRVRDAVSTYIDEVRRGQFPTEAHSFSRQSRKSDKKAASRAAASDPDVQPGAVSESAAAVGAGEGAGDAPEAEPKWAETIPLYPGVSRK